MKYKIAFSTQGPWKSVDADAHAIDERLLLFLRDGQPVLSCLWQTSHIGTSRNRGAYSAHVASRSVCSSGLS